VWVEQGTITDGRAWPAAAANTDCVTPNSSFECSYVRQLKNNPGILGWIFDDEPNMGSSAQIPPTVLHEQFVATKAADTDHPLFVNYYGPDLATGSTNAGWSEYYHFLKTPSSLDLDRDGSTDGIRRVLSDVAGGDWYAYPFAEDRPVAGLKITLESELTMTDNIWALNYGMITLLPALDPIEGHNYSATSPWLSDCTDAIQHPYEYQFKNELWLHVIHGGKGLLYFPWFCVNNIQSYQEDAVINFKTALFGTDSLKDIVLRARSSKFTPVTQTINSPGIGNISVPLNHATVTAGTDGRVDYTVREAADGKIWVFAARVKKYTGEVFANCTEKCSERLVINAAPSGTWAVSDTITGLTSGATSTISSIVHTQEYVITGRSGNYSYGETLTNGTYTAANASYMPVVGYSGGWPDANNTNTKSATIPVTGLIEGTTITVYGESRNISAGNGTITDNFLDYDVHIYSFDEGVPALSSITIGSNGQSWTFAYSEAMHCDTLSNCCDDFVAAMTSAGSIALSYSSGSGTASIVCTGSPIVYFDDTVANGGVDYTTVTNGIENSENIDLGSFTDKAVTNNSTQTTSYGIVTGSGTTCGPGVTIR